MGQLPPKTTVVTRFLLKKGWVKLARNAWVGMLRAKWVSLLRNTHYQICKHYYQKASNKQAAVRYMIELNLTDENAKRFLSASGYELAQKVSN